MRYLVHSLIVQSNVEIPGLPAAPSSGPADVTFSVVEQHDRSLHAQPSEPPATNLRLGSSPSQPFLDFQKLDSGYRLCFQQRWDFRVATDGSHVSCATAVPMPGTLVRFLFIDWVFPLIIQLRGMVGLHASAVALHGGALAFAGHEGAGKSTLVAALAARGLRLLADDVVAIHAGEGTYRVAAHLPEVRLFPASVGAVLGTENAADGHRRRFDKVVLPMGPLPAHSEPSLIPLRAIYLLKTRTGASIRASRLESKLAAAELLKHSFLIPQRDPFLAARQFRMLCMIVEQVPCYTLEYPHCFDLLPDLVSTVVTHAEGVP